MPRHNQELFPGTSPLHLWGSEVRRYREILGWSLDQTGKRVFVTGSHIGAIERGQSRCKRDLAVLLDEALEANGSLIALWQKLVANAVFPAWFDWPIYETKATSLQSYQGTVIDGLLQTEDYARVVLRGDETAVAARMERQSILTREHPPPPHVSVLMDESVLYRNIGGPKVMHDQLDRLVSSVSRRVSLYIVPSEDHDGLSGSFVLATLENRSEVAYVDTAVKGFTVSSDEDITTLTESLLELRSRALSAKDSMALISRTMEERWT